MASNSAQTPGQSNSYTAMAVGDVEAVGAHCQMEYCHQLDFLPFRCDSCKGKFCLDHRSETAHKCSNAGAWARAKAARNGASTTSAPSSKPNILTHEQQCSHASCKTLIDTPLVPGVHCQTCNRRYCLKHRMKETHACSTLTPLGARPVNGMAVQKEKGLAALEKLRIWGASKKASTVSSFTKVTTTEAKRNVAKEIAAANALKVAAKGDGKIPIEKRVYLHVEASADTTKAKFPT